MDIPPAITDLLRTYSLRTFKKGQTLLFQGEVPRQAYIISSGTVKTYNISPLGDEQIISINAAGDILPEAWLWGEANVAYYFYEAYTDCQVYAIPRADLTKKVEDNPELLRHMLKRYVRLYVGTRVHINALEQPRSRDKLIHLLHYLTMRFGKERRGGTTQINLRLTHQALADMLGTTRETIATELSRLRREGVIDYRQQMYFINKAKLLRLRNEDELITKL